MKYNAMKNSAKPVNRPTIYVKALSKRLLELTTFKCLLAVPWIMVVEIHAMATNKRMVLSKECLI